MEKAIIGEYFSEKEQLPKLDPYVIGFPAYYLGILSMIFIILFAQLAPSAVAQISAYRSEIKIIAETGSPRIVERQVQLASPSNVTGAIASWSDLYDDVTQRSINASRITVTPTIFDVKQLEGPTLLNVIINASDIEPGVYTGRMLIIQGSGVPLNIAITLTLHHPTWWALAVVGIGVGLAIVVQLLGQDKSRAQFIQGKRLTNLYNKTKIAAEETGGFAYIVFSILAIVAILSAWQTYFPGLVSFGRMGWLDYVVAFLSGFGSGAVVNTAANALRKRTG